MNVNTKFALFSFNGEIMCFAHALLNAIDLYSKGYEVKLIIEGSSTKLLTDFEKPEALFYRQYRECIEKKILDCVCEACSRKMGTYETAVKNNLPLCSELSGHPSMSKYIGQGFDIITF